MFNMIITSSKWHFTFNHVLFKTVLIYSLHRPIALWLKLNPTPQLLMFNLIILCYFINFFTQKLIPPLPPHHLRLYDKMIQKDIGLRPIDSFRRNNFYFWAVFAIFGLHFTWPLSSSNDGSFNDTFDSDLHPNLTFSGQITTAWVYKIF